MHCTCTHAVKYGELDVLVLKQQQVHAIKIKKFTAKQFNLHCHSRHML